MFLTRRLGLQSFATLLDCIISFQLVHITIFLAVHLILDLPLAEFYWKAVAMGLRKLQFYPLWTFLHLLAH